MKPVFWNRISKAAFAFLIVCWCAPSHAQSDTLLTLNPNWQQEIQQRKRVSIVFAGQNLKSPASLFGHTFLVFHDKEIPEPDAYSIEFIGDLVKGSPVEAFVTSIPGRYVARYFYQKQREYDLEDRNLWVYELTLTDSERIRIANLVRERVGKSYPYTFSRLNCSYYILDLVDEATGMRCRTGLTTLPIMTVRELKSCGKIRNFRFLSSQVHRLEQAEARLPPKKQTRVHELVRGYLPDEGEFADPVFKQTVNEAVNYRLIREPDPYIRSRLFNLKRQVASEMFSVQSPEEPLAANRFRYFGISAAKGQVGLHYLHTQRNIYSLPRETAETSYLEALAVSAYAGKNGVGVSNFTAFRMLSLRPQNRYIEGFTRYVDIRYVNHSMIAPSLANEINLRWGLGLSTSFFERNTIGIIPYLGIRPLYFKDDQTGLTSDLGAMAVLVLNSGRNPRLMIGLNSILETSQGYRTLMTADVVFAEFTSFNLGAQYTGFDFMPNRSLGTIEVNFFL